MNKIEILGMISGILITISMCFKTTSTKGSLIMRILNLVGSICFVVYGFMIPAYSTAFLNVVVTGVNSYHLFILSKDFRKAKKLVELLPEDTYNNNEE